jgi:hypothetical protein
MLGLLDIEGGNVEDPPIGQVFLRGASSDARVVEATRHLEEAAAMSLSATASGGHRKN